MKYICMGYYEPTKLAAMTKDERNATIQQIAIGKWQMAVHDHQENKVLHSPGAPAPQAQRKKGHADRLSLLHRPAECAILHHRRGQRCHTSIVKWVIGIPPFAKNASGRDFKKS